MAITKTNAMRRLDAAKIPYRVMEYVVDENGIYRYALATHRSILAWRIPWTEEPGGLQSMGV